MIKGYLTVFLSLTLSLLIGFVLLLSEGAVQNGNKVRFECVVDTGMNATLGEYHVGLLEEYDLLYIDTSYLGKEPSTDNLESRLHYYVTENLEPPWGYMALEDIDIISLETAAADYGASMRSQACEYIFSREDSIGQQWKILDMLEDLHGLEAGDTVADWNELMTRIAEMELPQVKNEEGKWEELPLSNPADGVYGLLESDIFYLAGMDTEKMSVVSIQPENYISHRQVQNVQSADREYNQDEGAYLTYLFEKMGYVKNPSEDTLLSYQLEYVVCGGVTDYENVSEVWKRIFRWRFKDNLSCAKADKNLCNEAESAAYALPVVQLRPEFQEPVAESILYACAFLESVNDIKVLYRGGEVPLSKVNHNMSVAHVLYGALYEAHEGEGLSYKEYLAGMLLLMDDKILNLRVMDVMEMEMRMRDQNPNFAMDWCAERYEARVTVRNSFGRTWEIHRKYGYY